jgi:tRNA(His) 5'-end guanylyltransferase
MEHKVILGLSNAVLERHGFLKPNDKPGLDLMSAAAGSVMREFNDLVIAYGQGRDSPIFKNYS